MTSPPVRTVGPSPFLIAAAATGLGLPLLVSACVALADPAPPFASVLVVLAVGLAVAASAFLLLRGRFMPGGATVLRVTGLVSLGLSLLAVISTLGVLTVGRGPGALVADLAAHAWLLAVLLVLAVPARTIGWLPLAGTAICGFLAIVTAARAVGVPVVSALGVDDVFATSVWVPVTEEVLKAVPIAVVAALALRGGRRVPAVDLGLLGAACGAGFAIAETARFGRVYAAWDSLPPISVVLPTIDPVGAPFPVVAGHAVWTGLVGLAIGFAVAYADRVRFAWVAVPAALVVVTAEHAITNLTDPPPLLLAPLLGGALSSVLLLAGFIGLAIAQRRRPLDRAALLAGLGVRTGARS